MPTKSNIALLQLKGYGYISWKDEETNVLGCHPRLPVMSFLCEVRNLWRADTSGVFHEHFTRVTYAHSKIRSFVLTTLHGSTHTLYRSMHEAVYGAYIATVVTWDTKMFKCDLFRVVASWLFVTIYLPTSNHWGFFLPQLQFCSRFRTSLVQLTNSLSHPSFVHFCHFLKQKKNLPKFFSPHSLVKNCRF